MRMGNGLCTPLSLSIPNFCLAGFSGLCCASWVTSWSEGSPRCLRICSFSSSLVPSSLQTRVNRSGGADTIPRGHSDGALLCKSDLPAAGPPVGEFLELAHLARDRLPSLVVVSCLSIQSCDLLLHQSPSPDRLSNPNFNR